MGWCWACAGEEVASAACGLVEVGSAACSGVEVGSAACGGVEVAGTDGKRRKRNTEVNTNDNHHCTVLAVITQEMLHFTIFYQQEMTNTNNQLPMIVCVPFPI